MPGPHASRHRGAILLAAFVTFLWSTSWVLIKLGLAERLPPLPFAGLRYALAALCLAPFALLPRANRERLRRLDGRGWRSLALLGLLFIAVAQGAQFAALALLPARTVSLFLNLTPVLVALASAASIGERVAPRQWAGTLVASAGVCVTFLPGAFREVSAAGLAAALVSLAANAAASLLGRKVNRGEGALPPLLVTFASISIGSAALLAAGTALQGLPPLGGRELLLIGWLAVVNTALAFTLWNRSLAVLTAVESSVLNGLMLPQIVLLAVVVLGESLSARQAVGLALVAVGTLVVQLPRPR